MSDFIPTVETLGDAALTNSIIDRSVTEILDNVITSIGIRSLYGCAALENVKFENATNVGTAAFYGCTSLAKADFYQCVSFGVNAFYGCSALTALILRNADAVSSFNSSFTGTPIASGTGYIYVPSALVDTYKSASGWSAYADQIRAIEDYPVICNPYTWESVFACIDDGSYASVYSIGDTVPLDLGSEGVVNMQIAAFDTDDLADGCGKAPITWISKELLKTSRRFNPKLVTNEDGTYQEGTGTIGGWEKSELRSYMNETVKTMIADNVRNRIVSVMKTHPFFNTTGNNGTQITNDSVWVPSYDEIYGDSSDMYQNAFKSVISSKKTVTGGTSYKSWWTRTAISNGYIRNISYKGGYENTGVNLNYFIALCFCT